MSDQTTPTKLAHLEAPASWNTRYLTADGFVCQLTLRAETGKDLLEKANLVLTWLRENGYKPGDFHTPRFTSPQGTPATPDAPRNGNGDTNHAANWCPIHHCEMKRWEKDGKVWFSHKSENGWCTGKGK